MMGRERIPVPEEELIEETIQMFLKHYRRTPSKAHRAAVSTNSTATRGSGARRQHSNGLPDV